MGKRKRLLKWVSLLRENRRLKKEYLALLRSVSDVMGVGEELLRVAREVKTAEEAIQARVAANVSQTSALDEYRRACDYGNEKLREAAIGDIVSASLNVVMDIDSRSRKIPWAYYDFFNQRLHQSPASIDFFKLNGCATRLTLRGLLENIAPEGRRAIEESLKSGEGLRHYKVSTSDRLGQPPKELFLSTYPFYFPNGAGTYSRAVGSAIFLYDPAFSFKRVRVSRFAGVVEKVAKECLEQLASNKLYFKSL